MFNPFARIFYSSFIHKFPITSGNDKNNENSERDKKYISKFISHLNNFFEKNKTTDGKHLHIDENNHNLNKADIKYFAHSMCAIMISGSRYIPNISSKYTLDNNIITLFDNISDLICKNSNKYDNIYDYCNFIVKGQNIIDATPATTNKRNIFIFGVSRDDQHKKETALDNYKHFMKDIANIEELNNENTEIYHTSFPTSYPEEIAIPEILGTVNNPEFYNEADNLYAQQYWHKFLGENIKFDEDGNIINGKKYSPEVFASNLKNLNILGYCAGAANAHRCLKAFKDLAEQLYSKDEVSNAMKNINFISFAFFPLEKQPDYTHTAIICNSKDETNPETTIRCIYPELYEKYRIKPDDIGKAKCSPYTEKDTILALELPKNPVIYDENNNPILREINNRNGHRLQNITAYNSKSPNFRIFRTIVKLALTNKLTQKNIQNITLASNTKNKGKSDNFSPYFYYNSKTMRP